MVVASRAVFVLAAAASSALLITSMVMMLYDTSEQGMGPVEDLSMSYSQWLSRYGTLKSAPEDTTVALHDYSGYERFLARTKAKNALQDYKLWRKRGQNAGGRQRCGYIGYRLSVINSDIPLLTRAVRYRRCSNTSWHSSG